MKFKNSPFKDQLEQDLYDIFINFDEFAEVCTITDLDTKKSDKYMAVLEWVEKDTKEAYENVSQAVDFIVYMITNQSCKQWKAGKAIDINGTIFTINEAFDEVGLWVMRCKERMGY